MPPHVKAMFEGDNGLLAGMDKGKVWIDHSTTDYEATMIYNNMVLDKGAQLLEAPITGTTIFHVKSKVIYTKYSKN